MLNFLTARKINDIELPLFISTLHQNSNTSPTVTSISFDLHDKKMHHTTKEDEEFNADEMIDTIRIITYALFQ